MAEENNFKKQHKQTACIGLIYYTNTI